MASLSIALVWNFCGVPDHTPHNLHPLKSVDRGDFVHNEQPTKSEKLVSHQNKSHKPFVP